MVIYFIYSLYFDGTKNESSTSGLRGDQLNKKIATDFISSLRERRQNEQSPRKRCTSNDDDEAYSDEYKNSKHVYKAPRFDEKIDDTSTEDSSKTIESSKDKHSKTTYGSSHSSKAVVMEAFEFGSTTNNTKKTRKLNTDVLTIDAKDETSLLSLPDDTNVPSLSYDFHDDDVECKETTTTDEQTSTSSSLEDGSNLFKPRKKKSSYRKRNTDMIGSSLSEIPEEQE